MIVEIQRNETEFLSVDLGLVDDEDIANEARERNYIVMERQPLEALYEKARRGENLTENLKELFNETIGRIL